VERVDGDTVQRILRLLDDPAASWPGIRVGLLEMLVPDQRSQDGTPDAEHAVSVRSAFQAGRSDLGSHQAETVPHAKPEWPPDGHFGLYDRTASDAPVEVSGESGEPFESGDREWRPGDGRKSRFDLLGRFVRRESSTDVPSPETMMFDEREWPGTTGRMRDTGRARWLSACGAVLAVALIWRYLYLPSPGTDRLLISFGASLLAAGGLFLLWQRLAARDKGWLEDAQYGGGAGGELPDSGEMAELRPAPESGDHVGFGKRTDTAELRFPWLTGFSRDNGPGSNTVFTENERIGGAIGAGAEAGDSPERIMAHPAGLDGGPACPVGPDGDETGLLPDETVLLDRDGDDAIWLVREYEGQHRRIPVEPGTQVIGRSEAHAGIIDTAEGVSRAHLELTCEDGEVRIKDLASRNGTLLEGEIMIPYKEYALRDGGVFRLAGPDGPKYTLRRSG